MKKQKLYELPINAPLTPSRREAVEKYIAANAHVLDEPVSYAWSEEDGDVLHITGDRAQIDVIFDATKVDVYFAAPSWARLLFTKAKRAQVREQLEAALREADFSSANYDIPATVTELAPGAEGRERQRQLGSEAHTGHENEITSVPTVSEGEPMTAAVKETREANPLTVLGEALESAAESIGDATSDARASAQIAARKVKKNVGTGVYYTAYGLSYGVVFSAVFLTELLPETNALRRGFEDGTAAAIEAATHRRVEALADESDERTELEPALAR
jgi:hypothetical protein